MALTKNRAFSRVASFVETSEDAKAGASAQVVISDSTGETMIFHPDGTMDQIDENGNITTKTMVSKEESVALSIALG